MNRTRRSRLLYHAVRLATLTLAAALVSAALPSSAIAGRVFVDPGHGGPYPGAVSGGVSEAYVNLLLSTAVRDALAARGHTTAMSRESDVSPGLQDRPTWHYLDDEVRYYKDGLTGVYAYKPNTGAIPYDDLQARCDMANRFGADVFVSIHCDASTSSSARGTATYRNWDNETDSILSARLAAYVQGDMMAYTSPYYSVENDGTKVVGFYVVRWSNMPAILVESAFLSNPYERALLLDPAFRNRLAMGIASGVDRFLDEKPFTPRWDRIAGATRYETAARIARDGWPAGADTVLLASGESWPDALAATPLSTRLDAPLLLTPKDRISGHTRDALSDLAPSQIIVLGGPAAVSETATALAAQAAGLPASAVRRVAGADRYETSVAIAREAGVPGTGRVTLVSGASYADALSISSHAGREGTPILLTHRSQLPTSVADYLRTNDASIGRTYVAGGDAVVSDALVVDLRSGSYGFDPLTVSRIWGQDRYDTNAAMIEAFWPTGEIEPYVATGVDFPDALSAGALAAKRGEPIVLLGGRYLSGYTRELLINADERVADLTMVGGPAALPYLMDWEIEKALTR